MLSCAAEGEDEVECSVGLLELLDVGGPGDGVRNGVGEGGGIVGESWRCLGFDFGGSSWLLAAVVDLRGDG